MSTYATDAKTSGMTKEQLLETAKRCFKLACDTETKQRQREKEDLEFQIPENQWSDAAKMERNGGTFGGRVVPPRPMLSISLLHQPMQLVQNQAANAKLGVSIHPVSEDADDDLAEIKEGLYRRIERDSNADQARLWALDRAKQCGRGWYRVNTQWDEDGDDPFDQEIVIERILHQECVYMDPAAQKADFSDAEWAIVASWVPFKTFKRLYPKAKASLTGPDDRFAWESLVSEAPDWVRSEGSEKAVLIAEYFYKDHDYQVMERGGRKREMDRVTVKWCKLTGSEVLEEEDWNGHLIPLIPVIGRELQPFDGERRWEGMVRPARDSQKFFNFAATSMLERMALEPKVPWVMVEEQAEGNMDMWQQSNTRNFPALFYKPVIHAGALVPPPARTPIDGTGFNLGLMAVQEGKSLVQSATAIFDPSLGRNTSQNESGRKVLALQQQSDAGTSHYIQGMATVSMPYEARVVLDLMPAIYDRPGRVTRVLAVEDEEHSVMLGVPFILDPKTQRPVPAQEGQEGSQLYDLSRGKYSTSVSVGKSYQTRLQEGSDEIGQILQADPSLMPLIGATYFRFRDFPGATEIADILKKVRDKQIPGLEEGKDGKATPEQLQAKVEAMQQQGQMLQAQLEQAMEMIKTDRAKQEAMILKAQLDAKTKLQLQQMGDAKDMQIARLNAQVKGGTMAQEAHDEQIVKGEDHAFEFDQNEKDRELERELAHFDAAHEVGMAAAGGNTVKRTREGGQEQENEQGQETSSGRSSATAPEKQEGGE